MYNIQFALLCWYFMHYLKSFIEIFFLMTAHLSSTYYNIQWTFYWIYSILSPCLVIVYHKQRMDVIQWQDSSLRQNNSMRCYIVILYRDIISLWNVHAAEILQTKFNQLGLGLKTWFFPELYATNSAISRNFPRKQTLIGIKWIYKSFLMEGIHCLIIIYK